MRGIYFRLAVIVCVVAAAFLVSGYVSHCDGWVWVRRGAGLVEGVAGTDRGRVLVYFYEMGTVPPGVAVGMPRGPVGGGGSFRLGWPDWRRSGWAFDGHRINVPRMSAAWIFACPIWCLLLPCLGILIWVWRGRRKVEGRGFAVEVD